ncbi:MAG: hypothetical protein ACE5ID_12425, partial [Acidobacteriota bacterium]
MRERGERRLLSRTKAPDLGRRSSGAASDPGTAPGPLPAGEIDGPITMVSVNCRAMLEKGEV